MSKQRTSSRVVKLSKSFRHVDEDTKNAFIEQRLLSLEADNYNEQELTGELEEENFDSDDSDEPKKKRVRKAKGGNIRTKW